MRPSGAKRESAEVGFSNALRPKNHLVKALAYKQQIVVIDAEICVFQLGTLEGKRIKWRHKVLLSETDGNVQSAGAPAGLCGQTGAAGADAAHVPDGVHV